MGLHRQSRQQAHSDQKLTSQQTLTDFRAGCGTFFSYVWLWILVIITVGVYAADTFTAVKLLAFDEWSSEIKPQIPFDIAKWIFSGCIMLSWALAIYSWIHAIRTIKRGCVTEDYLDGTAATMQSIRPGGWKRFLVFAALTKSKKKVSWIAVFVYFERQGFIRLVFAEGPRQVINALTLYSVGKASLIEPGKGVADRSGFDQFFYNLKKLGDEERNQTLILSLMAFTLFIWVISMLILLLALILYIIFLWHYIQNETLTGFCRRKIETRLARIVKDKSDKELARQQRKWEKAERKGSPTNSLAQSLPPKLAKQPTLPMMGGSPPQPNGLFRSDTMTTTSTLPAYASQAATPAMEKPPPFSMSRAPTLPDMNRPGSAMSNRSVSDAPLLGSAVPMGYAEPNRSGPMNRSLTGASERSYTPNPMPGRPPLAPLSTQGGPRYPAPSRTNTGMSGRASPMDNYTPLSAQSTRPLLTGQSPMSPYSARTQSPAPGTAYEMTPVETRGDYFGSGPQRQPTLPSLDAGTPAALLPAGGRRDMSAPARGQPPAQALPWPPNQRSATAPIPDYARGPPPRSHTAGPQGPPPRSNTSAPQGPW